MRPDAQDFGHFLAGILLGWLTWDYVLHAWRARRTVAPRLGVALIIAFVGFCAWVSWSLIARHLLGGQ